MECLILEWEILEVLCVSIWIYVCAFNIVKMLNFPCISKFDDPFDNIIYFDATACACKVWAGFAGHYNTGVTISPGAWIRYHILTLVGWKLYLVLIECVE